MEMTKKRLEEYRSEKQEIEELKCRLRAVVDTNIDTYWAQKEYLLSEINRLGRRCQDVEHWIKEIPESTIRRIFRLYYEDGKKQREIATILHIDQSNISKKIEKYLSEITL